MSSSRTLRFPMYPQQYQAPYSWGKLPAMREGLNLPFGGGSPRDEKPGITDVPSPLHWREKLLVQKLLAQLPGTYTARGRRFTWAGLRPAVST